MINNKILPGNLSVLMRDNPQTYLERLISWAITLVFVMAIVYFFFNFIMGGIAWMGSGGDKGQLQEARMRVINSVIGLTVVIGLGVVTTFIGNLFGVNILAIELGILQV